MKKLRIFPLILIICLAFAFAAPAGFAVDDPKLSSAKAVVVADMKTGRIIYSLNMNETRAPASLTKVMTVLVALDAIENGEASLEDIVTAGNDCREGLGEDSSTAGIMPGEQMKFEDLLYCAMVHSANEACNVVASHISGSVNAFVERMNAKAEEIGCTGTHFVNPNGLPAENHYSTAYDMYLITKEALKYTLFELMSNTVTYTVPATNLSPERTIENSNALICADSIYGPNYLYEGAAGVKTGYTRAAGYCLISTAERNDVRLMAVVMGCDGVLNSMSPGYENFDDTIALYNWSFDNFSYFQVLSASAAVQRVNVKLAEEGTTVNLRPVEDVTLLLPNDTDPSSIFITTDIREDLLVAPIEEGTVLGTATVSINGEDYARVSLINTTAVELSRKEFFNGQLNSLLSKTWVKLVIIILAVAIVAYIIMLIRYRILRRRAKQRRKEAERRRRAAEAARRSYADNHSGTRRTESTPRQDGQFDEFDFKSDKENYW